MQAAMRRLLRFLVCRSGSRRRGWAASGPGVVAQSGPLRIEVSVPASAGSQPIDGRVLLMLSTDPSGEPRFQINDDVKTQQVFGVDVDGLAPGKAAVFDAAVLGYPVASLAQVPPGTYTVQALLHRYETFRRADGHTVKLPMDRGEGQQWNRAPGNLYSAPQKLTIDSKRGGTVRLVLDQVIPPIPDPPDTKYVKHVRIQSDLLTKFWGRPDVPRRARAAAGGLGHAPAGAVSARHQPRALPVRLRRLPRDAPRPGPEARAQRPLQLAGLQPDRAGARPPVLQGLDRPGLPAVPDHRDPAREPVLRRLVRGELGEPRPLRRRDRQGADSRTSRSDSAASGRDGRGSCTGDRRAAGRPWARRSSTPTSSTAPTSPAPTRSTSAPTRPSTSTRTRTRTTAKAPGGRWRGPATATTWATSTRPSAT